MASNHPHLSAPSIEGDGGTGGLMDFNEEVLNVSGSFDYGDEDEVQLVGQRMADDPPPGNFAGESLVGADPSSTREVTPVPEAALTLRSTLCGRAKEVVGNLQSRTEMLKGLCEEGVDLFSPGYYGMKKEVIDELLRDAAATVKATGAKNQKVGEHLVKFNTLLRADEANAMQTPNAVAFLEFMGRVRKRHDADVAAQEAKKQRLENARGGTQKGPPLQMRLTWDPSKMHRLCCPTCKHFTVMEIPGDESAQDKCDAFKAEMAKWKALPAKERRQKDKPVPDAKTIGTSFSKFVCMCCTMTCLNGSGSCPRCSERHPGFDGARCICEQCTCNCSVVFTAKTRGQLVRQASNPVARPIGTCMGMFTTI